jgi:protein O-GlcNAc transferase
MHSSERFRQAVALHHAGQLVEAQTLYEEVLAIDPGHCDAVNMLGAIAMQKRNLPRALELYGKAIEMDSGNPVAYFNSGFVLWQLRQLDAALARYDQVLTIKPDFAEAHFNRGNVLRDLNLLPIALTSYRQAIAIDPDYAEAHVGCGNVLREQGQWEAARTSYDQAIALVADYEEAYFGRALVLHELRQWEAALASYDQVITLKADHAGAYCNRGLVLHELKKWDAALASLNQAIALQANLAEAHANRGLVLCQLRQWDAALASLNQAIALKADYYEAYLNRANVLHELQHQEAALASCNQAIALKADYPEAYLLRGSVLHQLRQREAALASLNQAIAIRADYPEAYLLRGSVLHQLGHREAALASLNQAVALKADYPEAYLLRGSVLHELRQREAALASYTQAIELQPGYADAYIVRGQLLHELNRSEEALTDYARALELKPDRQWLYGAWLHMKMHVCNWTGLELATARLVNSLEARETSTPPFVVLGLVDSPPLQLRAAEIWVEKARPASLELPPIDRRPRDGQIRVGYFSADMHNSAMAHLMAKVFESHDRERFHVVGLSFGPDRHDDEVRKRLSSAFVQFIDVHAKSPLEIAQLSRQIGLDIAVDLMGSTRNERAMIFAHRAAPIQVSFLGYPGTMGASYVDYIIADRIVIHEQNRRYCSEKVVYLPHSYYPTSYRLEERTERTTDLQSLRVQLKLPISGFVFCCFNHLYKVTPDVFEIWMRLLRRVEGSVLWLLQNDEAGARNLRKEAQARGVSEERLIFAPRTSTAQHLARHHAADLFLDTIPCNAHTTASDALWMGLPVLTLTGKSFAARVASSLLHTVGMPELICSTAEEYETAAIALATDPERLTRTREKLNRNRLTSPLFDSQLLTRYLEQAYLQIYECFSRGLAPEDMEIPSELAPTTLTAYGK